MRDFHVDPAKGFFLNGQSYPLHGVSRHQDWKGIGNAVTREHHDMDMAMIRELGDNTISRAKELVIQNYNHPCIVCWGVSNEITISTKDKADMPKPSLIWSGLSGMWTVSSPTVPPPVSPSG